MKILRTRTLIVAIGLLTLSMQACKTKKIVAKPVTPTERKAPVAEEKPAPAPVEEEKSPAVEEVPNFKFTNVQFEFNSDVLKTASFAVLDEVVAQMKKSPNAQLTINGNSSTEGSAAHNMSLSVDRANAVKSYLVNAGLDGKKLNVKGYGATNPVAPNTTEAGKALNRRVEFKVK
ncbi:OmpA family protein [Pedobacter gandavensis]|uniref:OmpA family protein n=1 Tax=Pedobacter gandavensis TaxID=2679963 RepID=A0ABR6EYP8_9SPHI|nr:OmpA family protein [Pedobacter gandavensis]MBB2150381.1 OmpA family protein [Pedobacter gandavensis]